MGRLYSGLVRPLLFALPAAGAHSLANLGLGLPLPWATIAGPPVDPALSVELAGLKLRNPLGLAAGFDKNCSRLDTLASLGFGYVVGGTVTLAPRAGNAKPRVGRYPARQSLVNAMGFPNPGADAVYDRLRMARLSPKLVSISGSRSDEVMALFERLEPTVDGIEFNVSCPNVRWGRDVDTEALLTEVMPRLRDRSKK